jgi:hypothetical protein
MTSQSHETFILLIVLVGCMFVVICIFSLTRAASKEIHKHRYRWKLAKGRMLINVGNEIKHEDCDPTMKTPKLNANVHQNVGGRNYIHGAILL